MTTTLRPVGPEQRDPDGRRFREYHVCVNSRPVGRIALCTDTRYGPGVGRIQSLRIDEADRGRGRGVVAALAAEEVLRSWGCRRAEASVPAGAAAALGLARTLGYTERNRTMVKRIPEHPPPLPGGCEVRPMSEAEFVVWRARGKREYARSLSARGLPEAEARARSEADHAVLLPEGRRTPGALLRVLSHHGTDVGTIWVSLTVGVPDDLDAYVFDVEVAGEHRGHGHGRALMLLAEHECRDAGAERLGLNVFSDNTPAVRLYESLGYETTRHHLVKALI